MDTTVSNATEIPEDPYRPDALISDHVRSIVQIVGSIFICGPISIIGLLGNVINLVVFYRQGPLEECSTLIFFALALADIGCLLSVLVVSFLDVALLLASTADSNTRILFAKIFVSWLHVASVHVVSWMTAFITCHRYICVVSPFKARTLISVKNTLVTVVAIAVLIPITFTPAFTSNKLTKVFDPNLNSTVLQINTDMDMIKLSVFTNSFILRTLILLVVFVCNKVIIYKVKLSKSWRETMATGTGNIGGNALPKVAGKVSETDSQPTTSSQVSNIQIISSPNLAKQEMDVKNNILTSQAKINDLWCSDASTTASNIRENNRCDGSLNLIKHDNIMISHTERSYSNIQENTARNVDSSATESDSRIFCNTVAESDIISVRSGTDIVICERRSILINADDLESDKGGGGERNLAFEFGTNTEGQNEGTHEKEMQGQSDNIGDLTSPSSSCVSIKNQKGTTSRSKKKEAKDMTSANGQLMRSVIAAADTAMSMATSVRIPIKTERRESTEATSSGTDLPQPITDTTKPTHEPTPASSEPKKPLQDQDYHHHSKPPPLTTTSSKAVSYSSSVVSNQKRLVWTISIISTIFLVCNTPDVLAVTLLVSVPSFRDIPPTDNLFPLLMAGQFILETINSSLNIVVYYNMSSKYRRELRSLIRSRSD